MVTFWNIVAFAVAFKLFLHLSRTVKQGSGNGALIIIWPLMVWGVMCVVFNFIWTVGVAVVTGTF